MATTADITRLEGLITTLQGQVTALTAADAQANTEVNAFYLLWAGTLVFLMQAGFATLSAGSIRSKNVKNILLKNLLDACIGAITFYFVGFAFAYSDPTRALDVDPFIGGGGAFYALQTINDHEGNLANHGYDWTAWFFQFAFAAAAATIVSGAVAERCALPAYLIYTCAITGFIYPVVAHWVWDTRGWLYAGGANAVSGGCFDFAGSGVVHMTGGFAALVGAKILGPRIGRWEKPEEFAGHSTPLQVIGTFLLWFGWYGFNPGSTLNLHANTSTMARAAVTTTLAAASAGVFGLFLKRFLPKKLGGSGIFDIGHTCNSILGGLVAITAGCATISVPYSVVTGIVGAIFYHLGSCTMRKLKIDDPLDAFAVHGACGVWGVLAVGLLARKEYTGGNAGLFMPQPSGGKAGEVLGAQVIALVAEIAWVVTLSGIVFTLLKVCRLLRVPADVELGGLDESKHGGSAYPTNNGK